MSELWLLEAYEDPYIHPYTIGAFESKDALVDGVENHFNYESIEWHDNYVILGFGVKMTCSDKIRSWKERFDFRPIQLGVIDE